MRSHSDIVKAAGVDVLVGRTGASPITVRSWIQRDKIPADLWAEFVSNEWATLEELAEGARPRKGRGEGQQQAAA